MVILKYPWKEVQQDYHPEHHILLPAPWVFFDCGPVKTFTGFLEEENTIKTWLSQLWKQSSARMKYDGAHILGAGLFSPPLSSLVAMVTSPQGKAPSSTTLLLHSSFLSIAWSSLGVSPTFLGQHHFFAFLIQAAKRKTLKMPMSCFKTADQKQRVLSLHRHIGFVLYSSNGKARFYLVSMLCESL